LRNSTEEGRDLIIAHYDSILRDDKAARILQPQAVLQIGHLPTSKILRDRLKEWNCPGWTVSPFGENYDPLHSSREKLQIFPEALEKTFQNSSKAEINYSEAWQRANASVAQQLQTVFNREEKLFEGKISWTLNEYMPKGSHLHIASSMPIRDVEFFWRNHPVSRTLSANRGANGIDGTLSTAMGVAQDAQHTYLLTGDLAFLHDINGLLIGANPRFRGCLTVVLVNNQGGGIFENLPIARHNPPFEEFFATPQKVDFSLLAQAHNIPYRLIENWETFANLVANPTNHAIRILEIRTDRKADTPKRKEILRLFSTNYSS
jgi:2-succinyl-5-enolpyruvyl-6-hydroxy-3-cyclohexene-1-carboxylate synthase